MIDNINKHLELIEKFLKWVNETEKMKGDKGEQAHNDAVDSRMKLKKKKFALEGNPSVAVFGQSQVGKSYLISALLSETDKGKEYEYFDKASGVSYNFKEEMNPPGGGTESTAVVSRFSVDYHPIDDGYPIKAVLFSVADIVMALCDTYYRDVRRENVVKSEDIDLHLHLLKEQYSQSTYHQDYFTEDDVRFIFEYMTAVFTAEIYGKYEKFLKEVSLLVENVPPTAWKNVLSILWNNNAHFSSLFDKLIEAYQKLSFSREVYLPVEAVLRINGTMLDVEILKGITETIRDDIKETDVLLVEGANRNVISNFSKPLLSALVSELVFNLPENTKQIKGKEFLAHTDLLDFPGARARKDTPESVLGNGMWEYFLRGKVSYLFNKYSIYEKINILFFCAKHTQPDERAMPELLDPLVNRIIGINPSKREEYIRRVGNVSPLFIIGTFFNENLEYDKNKDIRSQINTDNPKVNPLLNRWWQRFDSSLAEQLVDVNHYEWFNRWTETKPYFNNIYLLRDFGYSDKIFTGFSKHPFHKEDESPRPNPAEFPDFRERLKQSFLEYDFVKKHFDNPELSWDEAASANKDGTSLILMKLATAAKNINEARAIKMKEELEIIHKGLINLFHEYHDDPEKSNQLRQAMNKAGDVRLNLAVAFGRNPYFFGKMMREMMLTNSEVYEFYKKAMHSIESHEVKNLDKYEAIRLLVPELDSDKDFMIKLEALLKHLKKEMGDRKPDEERAYWEEYFKKEYDWDLKDLFESKKERIKSRSKLMVEALKDYWLNEYLPSKQIALSEVLPKTHFDNLKEMFEKLFEKLQMTTTISERIRRYVDGYRNTEEIFEMISDISTEMINRFVGTVGTDYYRDFNYEDLEEASKNIEGLSWERPELQYGGNNREEVALLIDQMGNLPELLNKRPIPEEVKRLPIYRNYIEWYNRIDAGFVTASGVPSYDPIANEKLGKIIVECETIKS